MQAHDSSCGDILVSLMYKPNEGCIEGVILRVANLRGAELTGTRGKQFSVLCVWYRISLKSTCIR